MTRMKYKDFFFPHNPRRIEVTARQHTAEHRCPGGTTRVERLGNGCRTVNGEGELIGAQAASLFARLYQLSQQGEPGMLTVPGLAPFPAYFTQLDLVEEGDGRSLCYRFSFLEAERGSDDAGTVGY